MEEDEFGFTVAPYVLKLDYSGNEVWFSKPELSDGEQPLRVQDAVAAPNGGVAMSGRFQGGDQGLRLVDRNGAFEWTKEYAYSASAYALGAPVIVGAATTTPWQLELEDYGFRREHDNGTPSSVEDDWGAFVPADAYLVLDGSFVAEDSEIQRIDEDYPNQTGRTFVQKPLMVATAAADPGTDDGTMDPIVKQHTINDAPAYGVLVTGANHLTAVTTFDRPGLPMFSWSLLPQASTFLFGTQDGTPDETGAMAIPAIADLILEEMRARFTGVNGSTAYDDEEVRRGEFRRYTTAFFDAHLSGDFAQLPDPYATGDDYDGSTWLNADPTSVHLAVADIDEFSRREVTRAFKIEDASGFPITQFQSDGNIVLNKGTFYSCFSSFVESSSVRQFFVKKADGTIIAEIDDTVGDFRIRSTYAPLSTSVATSSANEFVVRRETDTGTNAQIIIDDSGALTMRGQIFKEGNVPVAAKTSCP